MVALAQLFSCGCDPLLAQRAEPLIERLDSVTRVKVLAALAALIILGFAMVLLTVLAGRATRRYMNAGRKQPPTLIDHDDWAKKPIHPDDGA